MTATAESSPMKWWIPLVQGIIAIILGLLLLANPLKTASALVLALGIYWLIIGVLELIGLLRDRTAWGWKLFMGVVAILAGGMITTSYFGNTGLGQFADILSTTTAVGMAFSIVIGVMAVVYGIVGLIGAFRGAGWGAGIMGGLGILFGMMILFNPLAATLSLPIALGILFIFGGIFMLVAAFRLR